MPKPKFKDRINILKIHTIVAYILKSNYKDFLEHHKYWEFVYVHKGKISISAENEIVDLYEGDLIIHPPFQKHKIEYYDAGKNKIVVCSFLEGSNLLYKLRNYKFHLDLKQRNIIKDIMGDLDINSRYIEHDAHRSFCPPYSRDRGTPLQNQCIKNYLEIFLANLILDQDSGKNEEDFIQKSESNKVKCENIVSLMQNNLYKNLTLDDICKQSYLGKTYISRIFKKNMGMSAMKYFTYLKIQKAKQLIKEGIAVSEVSKTLKFSSQNYFSRAFKSIEGISPSQYIKKSTNARKK